MKSTSGYYIKLVTIFGFTTSFYISILSFGIQNAYGVELYTEADSPFNISLDGWIGKWWNWWVATTTEEATPTENGCLMNNSNSMVMLMETTVGGARHQVCKISSNQGIIIPIWTAWMEGSRPPYNAYSYQQLSKAAREEANLGAITSVVKVDGVQIAKLDEVSSMRGGALDYKVKAKQNVTEIYSNGFNITIPSNTHYPEQMFGTWPSGSHGWYVFLKPLAPGQHTIYYNVGVTGTGPNDVSSEITYSLEVE